MNTPNIGLLEYPALCYFGGAVWIDSTTESIDTLVQYLCVLRWILYQEDLMTVEQFYIDGGFGDSCQD